MIRSKNIQDYFQARFELIKPGKEITFGLFLYFRENRHIMQWQRSGESPTPEWIAKYHGRGILRVWIHNDDNAAWEAYLTPQELAQHKQDQVAFAEEEKKLTAEDALKKVEDSRAKLGAPALAEEARKKVEAAALAAVDEARAKGEDPVPVAEAAAAETAEEIAPVAAAIEAAAAAAAAADNESRAESDGESAEESAEELAAGEASAEEGAEEGTEADAEQGSDAADAEAETREAGAQETDGDVGSDDAVSDDEEAAASASGDEETDSANGEESAEQDRESDSEAAEEALAAQEAAQDADVLSGATAEGDPDAASVDDLDAVTALTETAEVALDENGLPIITDLEFEAGADDSLSLSDQDGSSADDDGGAPEQEEGADWGSKPGEEKIARQKSRGKAEAAKQDRKAQERERKAKEAVAGPFADEKANERLAEAIKKAREKRKDEQQIKTEAGKKLWELLNNSKLSEQEKKEAVAAEARSLLSQTVASDKTNPQAARREARKAVEDVLKDMLKDSGSLLSELWEIANLDADLTHGANVATYASILAMAFGRVDPQLIADLALAGLTHDLGLTQVPVHVAKKAWASFSVPEKRAYSQHVDASVAMLQKHGAQAGAARALPQRTLQIAQQHHEKFDGSGYPQKLQGFKVDDVAQLLAIADLMESISTGRYDGQERTIEDTVQLIERLEKSKTFPEFFNPDVFAAVMRFIHAPAGDVDKESTMAILKAQTSKMLKAA